MVVKRKRGEVGKRCRKTGEEREGKGREGRKEGKV